MKSEARVRLDEVDPRVRRKFRKYFVTVTGVFYLVYDNALIFLILSVVYWFDGERE